MYRRQLKPAGNVIDYLAFVSFFPQLVAGPIERGTNLLPQFQKQRQFNLRDASDGCRLILWGFFKKLAVADVLAIPVDAAYSQWETASSVELALATVFFAFQIYCDFSAYSDIAIGTARLFSIKLMRNFAYPYFSQSLSEFWCRWHISLSTWFRDYVYIPIGGNRGGPISQQRNIFVTFLLSGLWHGAAWTFIIWGAIHGGALAIEKRFLRGGNKPALDFSHSPSLFVSPIIVIRMLMTFCLVCLGWVFFRAETIGGALAITKRIIYGACSLELFTSLSQFLGDEKRVRIALVVLIVFASIEWVQRKHECPLVEIPNNRLMGRPIRWAAYSVVILFTLDLMAASDSRAFIYFAF